MTEKLKNVMIYTDGGCLGNPGPGAMALYFYTADIGKSSPAAIA